MFIRRHLWIAGMLSIGCHNTTEVGTRITEKPASNAPASSEGSESHPSSAQPVAIDCAQLVSQMLAAPLAPPSRYAGFDLSTGMDPRGLTIEEANAAGCGHDVVETVPSTPGYRLMSWGDGAIVAAYNA